MAVEPRIQRVHKFGGGLVAKLLILLVTILIKSSICYAGDPPASYSYHPDSVMFLGAGVDPQNPYAAKNKCVDFETYSPDNNAALETRGRFSMAKSKEDLRVMLGMDAKMEARYLLFKGEASEKIDFNRAITSDSATFVITFYTEYGRQAAKNIKLTDHAQKLLTDRMFDQFRRECGSQWVSIVRRGASVSIVVTVHNFDSSTKAQLSGSIKGGIDLEIFGGALRAQVSSSLDAASNRGDVDVQVFSTGGRGFGDLADSLKGAVKSGTTDALTTIIGSLSEYIKQFNATNSAPIRFYVSPIPGFNEKYGDLWSEDKDSKLIALVDEFRQVKKDENTVYRIIKGDDPRVDYLKPAQINSLKPLLSQLTARATLISSVYANCIDAPVAQTQRCNIAPNNISLPDFLYPIEEMPSGFVVIVDGESWPRSRAAEVLEDPGPGSLLEKVRIRKPTARSAFTAFSFSSPYLSDVSIIVRSKGREYLQNVYYPGKTLGDQIVLKRGDASYITLRRSDPNSKLDLYLYQDIWWWYYSNICWLVRPGLGGTAPGAVMTNEYALSGSVIARARNRYGYTRDFQIANFEVSQRGPYDYEYRLRFQITHRSGEKPITWESTNRIICQFNLPPGPKTPTLPIPDPDAPAPNNLVLALDGSSTQESNFVPDPFGTKYISAPAVCLINNTAYPEGAIIDIGSRKQVCTSGKLQDIK